MKPMYLFIGFVISMLIFAGPACRRDADPPSPARGDTIAFRVPKGWPEPAYGFEQHTLTQQQGFELGRRLFYDVRLSRDNSISCGSCHAQFAAFSHLDHPLSHGIDGRFGTRNAQGLFNLAWKPAFFWDGGVPSLENQPQVPIENHVEMDLSLAEAVARINADGNYRKLFRQALGVDTISSKQLLKTLAQFMSAMVSADSKYDQFTRGESGGSFSALELQGLELFRGKCAGCHGEPLFTDFSYRNNGLLPDRSLNDSGRAHITGLPADFRKFMVPSLRNVDLTRPYMHDGRFNTLDAVLEHYRSGIDPQETLDPGLQAGIPMTDAEKAAIIAFLRTLTDQSFIRDRRFSEQ